MKVSIRSWEKSDAASLAATLSNKRILNNLRDGLRKRMRLIISILFCFQIPIIHLLTQLM